MNESKNLLLKLGAILFGGLFICTASFAFPTYITVNNTNKDVVCYFVAYNQKGEEGVIKKDTIPANNNKEEALEESLWGDYTMLRRIKCGNATPICCSSKTTCDARCEASQEPIGPKTDITWTITYDGDSSPIRANLGTPEDGVKK